MGFLMAHRLGMILLWLVAGAMLDSSCAFRPSYMTTTPLPRTRSASSSYPLDFHHHHLTKTRSYRQPCFARRSRNRSPLWDDTPNGRDGSAGNMEVVGMSQQLALDRPPVEDENERDMATATSDFPFLEEDLRQVDEDLQLELQVDQQQLQQQFQQEQQQFDQQQAILPAVDDEQHMLDERFMKMAIDYAAAGGGERSPFSAFPNPTIGAIVVSMDGRILGMGRSDYQQDAVPAALERAGLHMTPLQDWCVQWPASEQLRDDLSGATLYVTLEPCMERRGTLIPPITQLIQQSGIPRVVIGTPDPVPERATKGAASLHAYGLTISLGSVLPEQCQDLIQQYAALANGKLQRMARKHFERTTQPLGFMHCSVVDSDNIEAFANNGNAFGTSFGGKNLSYRDFGTYEIAPPPEVIWADTAGYMNGGEWGMEEENNDDDDPIIPVDFEEEDFQGDMKKRSPMMPWYEQVDAVVATFPRPGNGPPDDNSVTARLNGLKWLATHGNALPAGVERILVMDATDLEDLPVRNDDPHLPKNVDVEAFWHGHQHRKATRVLLRRGVNAQARAAAEAAALAAKAAAQAAMAAAVALEAGDAAQAAEAALEYQRAAQASTELAQNELQKSQALRRRLEEMGVVVETIEGGEPVDVMKHLGKRNGYHTVVWRAGCWGERGVRAILEGAFQWVSAHLAVDARGGKFWQLMLAENAVQAACGPERKVKVFADQEDISLEYCDEPDADKDCVLTIDGRPVRHVRLDCRVALVDGERPREFVTVKTKKLDRKIIEEEAPWFL